MTFYQDLQQTADKMLIDKGQRCMLGVVTEGAYDPATASATPSATSYQVTAAVFSYPQHLIDGTRVLIEDRKVLMSAYGLTVTPRPGDAFTDASGSAFVVVDAKATSPAGTVVVWSLQVRK